MKKIYKLLPFILLLSSCAIFKGKSDKIDIYDEYSLYEKKDYIDHLSSLNEAYIKTSGIRILKVNGRDYKYLENIYNKVISNNERLISSPYKPEFYLIKSNTPLYFSLPKGKIFFSTGLIKKFFTNESLLIAALAFETIKSNLGIYQKKILVPTGDMKTERILSIIRVKSTIRVEIYKWSFITLDRAGYDPYSVLHWLQTQNRNTLDFALNLGNRDEVSREEFMFKNFIVKEGFREREEKQFEVNSSKGFYNFLKMVRRI
jgi:hypothetical protein